MSDAQNLKRILLHTGNIFENQEIIKKVNKSTLEELHACVKSTLNNSIDQINEESILEFHGRESASWTDLLSDKNSKGLKTTVKIFLSRSDGVDVKNAIKTVKSVLRLDLLDTVIIVPPNISDDIELVELQPIWDSLQDFVKHGDVHQIGIADLSPETFKALYDWAEIKPSVIQLNLSTCCTVNEELTKFTSQKDVQVLTHNDEHEIVDEDLIETILNRAGVAGTTCELSWIARHRTIQTCYGVVASKGYTMAVDLGQPFSI